MSCDIGIDPGGKDETVVRILKEKLECGTVKMVADWAESAQVYLRRRGHPFTWGRLNMTIIPGPRYMASAFMPEAWWAEARETFERVLSR